MQQEPKVYLALRKTDGKGLGGKLFSLITRSRINTNYPHGAIVIGDELFHITAFKNVVQEPFLHPEEYDLWETDVPAYVAKQRFKQNQHLGYDYFGLLVFIVFWNATDSSRDYCFEFCHRLLKGFVPRRKIRPEDLLRLDCVTTRKLGYAQV